MILEQKLQLAAALVFVSVTLGVGGLLMFRKDFHAAAVSRGNARDEETYSIMGFLRDSSEETVLAGKTVETNRMKGHDFAMELPAETDFAAITYASDPMSRTFSFRVPGIESNYFTDYTMAGKSDGIKDMQYASSDGFGTIEITFNRVTEVRHTIDGHYLYFDFVSPHELYDKVVVLDAGHGGSDPGAGNQQGVMEKDINLAIMLKLKALFDADEKHRIGVYCTRTTDANPSLQERVELANESDCDLFLSVHNNSTSSGRTSSINGTAVMYRTGDETGASKAFAESVQRHLLAVLGSRDKGLIAGDEIYIVRTSKSPVALAEIGFLTNTEELKNLTDEAYQERAAEAMYEAVLETLGYTDF